MASRNNERTTTTSSARNIRQVAHLSAILCAKPPTADANDATVPAPASYSRRPPAYSVQQPLTAPQQQQHVQYQQQPMLMPPTIPQGYALVPLQNYQQQPMSRDPSIDSIDISQMVVVPDRTDLLKDGQPNPTSHHKKIHLLPKSLSVGEKLEAFLGDDTLLHRKLSRRYAQN